MKKRSIVYEYMLKAISVMKVTIRFLLLFMTFLLIFVFALLKALVQFKISILWMRDIEQRRQEIRKSEIWQIIGWAWDIIQCTWNDIYRSCDTP